MGAAFDHRGLAQKRCAIGLSAGMPQDNRNCLQQMDRDGRARPAVLPDLVESGVREVCKRHRIADHPQFAVAVMTIGGRYFPFREQAERRSKTVDTSSGSKGIIDARG